MTSIQSSHPAYSLGELIKAARCGAGMSFAALAERTGIGQGQLHRLEHDEIRAVNPAHLALLAEALGISLFRLYSAAGYSTEALSLLGEELEDKIRELPPEAIKRLDDFVTRLATETLVAPQPVEADPSDN